MGDALEEVEHAIVDVTKARESLARKKTKQVSSADEIDQMKSVALAWFNSRRSPVAAHPSSPDLIDVDAAYRTVLDSTARHAARTTYTRALKDAKKSLVVVRGLVAVTANVTPAAPTADVVPSFAPLAADPKMQAILNRRWVEVQQCIGSGAYLAATVMMGGLLESLLLARINSSANRAAVFTAKTAPRDKAGKTLAIGEWRLVSMVVVAHELDWVTKSAKDVGNVLRDFRNYIHPHKEYTDAITISQADAEIFWEVTKAVTRQLLNSVGKSP
ncbi:MAG: hypothetical protein IMZ65_03920 [Planctomycetes bacterium]|nr:hypothetical protein [Planctomycetota bacterium]